jgi:hypothetical protein
MNFDFEPSQDSSFGFRSVFSEVSMGERLLRQSMSDPAGFHASCDPRPHYDIRNSNGDITGHLYADGSVSDFNGSLGWL